MMKKDIEGLLDEIDEFITRAINVETTSQTIEMLSGMTIEQVVEGFRDGKFDMREELTMTKLETLTVPTDLGEWLQARRIGDSGVYFSMIDALYHYWENVLSSSTDSFIKDNKKELIEVILGTRGYRVEKPLYHALIKGHELLADHDALSFTYWNFNMSNGYLLHGNKFSKQVRFLTKMTKEDWNKLGINDSNADFVRVEEMAE